MSLAGFIPAPNVAELTATYSLPDGQVGVNVLHVSRTAAWTTPLLTTLANAYLTWESATTAGVNPAANRSNTVSLISVKARDLTSQFGPEVTLSPSGGPIVGGDASGALSNGLTVAVKLSTGLAGRSNRGRVFWIGLAADQLLSGSKNTITSAFGVSVVQAYFNLKNAVHTADASANLCVLSGVQNGVVRNPRVPQTVTTVSLVDQFCDFQRRRAPAHNRGG